jgi:hypothetical protein
LKQPIIRGEQGQPMNDGRSRQKAVGWVRVGELNTAAFDRDLER